HSDSLSSRELVSTGVGLMHAKRYRQAANAFEASLATNTCHHEALLNLATTFNDMALALDAEAGGRGARGARGRPLVAAARRQLGDSIVRVANRLVTLAPAGRGGIRLLAAGYQ